MRTCFTLGRYSSSLFRAYRFSFFLYRTYVVIDELDLLKTQQTKEGQLARELHRWLDSPLSETHKSYLVFLPQRASTGNRYASADTIENKHANDFLDEYKKLHADLQPKGQSQNCFIVTIDKELKELAKAKQIASNTIISLKQFKDRNKH